MKTIISVLPIILVFVLLKCDDSFLDTRPYGVEVPQILSETLQGAESLLIGAYSMLDGFPPCETCNGYAAAGSNWVYGSIQGGDAHKGSWEGDQPEINDIEIHNTPGNNPYPESKWVTYYRGIQRSNDAIRAFRELGVGNESSDQITESQRNERVAEAIFLRAFFHYDLYRVFLKIPFIDESVDDTRISNADPDAVLSKIRRDFKHASYALPLHQSEPGRITKGAAQSYLGIAFMWAHKYDSAKIMFDSVITSGMYALNATYHENFNADFRNSKESVLEVQQSVQDGATGFNGNAADVLNFPFNGPVGCCGFHQPSQDLVNAFKTDSDGLPLLDSYDLEDVKNDQGLVSSDPFTTYAGNLDPRLDWTVGRRGIPYLDWGIHPGESWIRKQPYGGPYLPVKNVFHQAQQSTVGEQGSWTTGYNSNNLKLLRYADLLLFAAEAEVELNNLEKARQYVNLVRERAMNPDGFVMDGNSPAANYVIKQYGATWVDKEFARKAVRFERRIELGMEGHRFFDLVRWGIAAEVKNRYFEKESEMTPHLTGAVFEPGKDEHLPIPFKAIQLSSKDGVPTLEQNDGY